MTIDVEPNGSPKRANDGGLLGAPGDLSDVVTGWVSSYSDIPSVPDDPQDVYRYELADGLKTAAISIGDLWSKSAFLAEARVTTESRYLYISASGRLEGDDIRCEAHYGFAAWRAEHEAAEDHRIGLQSSIEAELQSIATDDPARAALELDLQRVDAIRRAFSELREFDAYENPDYAALASAIVDAAGATGSEFHDEVVALAAEAAALVAKWEDARIFVNGVETPDIGSLGEFVWSVGEGSGPGFVEISGGVQFFRQSSVEPLLGAIDYDVTVAADQPFSPPSGKPDAIRGDVAANVLLGLKGSDTLDGVAGDDSLVGGKGHDVLSGGQGIDVHTGNLGRDTFRFSTLIEVGEVDLITDFTHGADKIALDADVFAALAPGAIDEAAFQAGRSGVDAETRLIYAKKTGLLFYDADGSGTEFKAVAFADVGARIEISAEDFLVV
jgi:hypothetical protein